MNRTSARVTSAVTVVRCLIIYRLGEKMLGRRPGNDYSIDLQPVYAVAALTEQEREQVIAELSKLKLDAELLHEL